MTRHSYGVEIHCILTGYDARKQPFYSRLCVHRHSIDADKDETGRVSSPRPKLWRDIGSELSYS
jgi:hypothetical protein